MRIFITGSKGQLGTELMEILLEDGEHLIEGYDKSRLDITDYQAVLDAMIIFKPDVVVNCAAYTDVANCEVDDNRAYQINHIGARNVARAANKINSKIIQVSTDYVFDGEKNTPYTETDTTNPLSVYGKTKLLGELAVIDECARHIIIRTSWLYGKYGDNFVTKMINLSKSETEINVVIDEIGTPTYTKDLVNIIKKFIDTEQYGIFNFSNLGQCSRYDFALKIFSYLGCLPNIRKICISDYKSGVTRPKYSVLSKDKLLSKFNIELRSWDLALEDFLNNFSEVKE